MSRAANVASKCHRAAAGRELTQEDCHTRTAIDATRSSAELSSADEANFWKPKYKPVTGPPSALMRLWCPLMEVWRYEKNPCDDEGECAPFIFPWLGNFAPIPCFICGSAYALFVWDYPGKLDTQQQHQLQQQQQQQPMHSSPAPGLDMARDNHNQPAVSIISGQASSPAAANFCSTRGAKNTGGAFCSGCGSKF